MSATAGITVRYTHAPRSLARATLHGGPPRPRLPHLSSSPVAACTALSHSSHPLTPTRSAKPGPASRVTRRGRAESKMATPPPPPPHSWLGQGAPSRGARAPEAQLKIARPDYIWCGRIPTRPRAPHPTPPRLASPAQRRAEWRRGGGDRGGTYSAICRAPATEPSQPPNLVTSPASITRLACVSDARL